MLDTGRDTPSASPDTERSPGPPAEPGAPGGRVRQLTSRVTTAAGLLVIVVLGVLVVSARGAVSEILLAQPTPTGTSAVALATPAPSPTAVPAGPVATLAPAIISTGVFWSGGGAAIGQSCDGAQTLGASSFVVDNSHSTVAVDWWVNVATTTPDGKQPWAATSMPYGTLPAGQSITVTVWPNPLICGQLAGRTALEPYRLDVSYAGVGGTQLVDSVKPPSATPGSGR